MYMLFTYLRKKLECAGWDKVNFQVEFNTFESWVLITLDLLTYQGKRASLLNYL